MKFLVDAHLPRRLAAYLRRAGHDAIHTLDLPNQNRTRDEQINEISVREHRIVITKDSDFIASYRVIQRPHKLLLVSTGNISNAELEGLFTEHLDVLTEAFATCGFVELTRATVILHLDN